MPGGAWRLSDVWFNWLCAGGVVAQLVYLWYFLYRWILLRYFRRATHPTIVAGIPGDAGTRDGRGGAPVAVAL